MVSHSDRTLRSGSESLGNRKAIANSSQIIAVTAPEAENSLRGRGRALTKTRGAGFTTSFRNVIGGSGDAMVKALTRPEVIAA